MDAAESHLTSLQLDNSGGLDLDVLNHRAPHVSSPLPRTNAAAPILADYPGFGGSAVRYHCSSPAASRGDQDRCSGGIASPSGECAFFFRSVTFMREAVLPSAVGLLDSFAYMLNGHGFRRT